MTIVLIGLLFIVGCSGEKDINRERKLIPATRLLKKLEGNRRKIKTFEGTGVLSIKSKKFTGKTSFKISIKKPDSIKISIYGPFGIDIAHGLFLKDKFIFYDVFRTRVITGKNSKDVLKKMFKINLSFEELIDAFAGAVNLTEKLRTEPTDYKLTDDTYVLTYTDTLLDKKTIYRITKENLKITEYQVASLNDKELLLGEYSKFKTYEGVPIPLTLLIRNRSKHESIRIAYKKVTVNKSIKSLKIKLPTDVTEIKW